MILRAVVVWVLLLGIAILNGGVREGWITPRFGASAGHVASTILLAAFILLTAWLTIGWIRPPSPNAALRVGLLWMVLTLAFEFLGGHYLFGRPWNTLWSDYDLSRGRIWTLIPIVTLLAPVLAGHLRGFYRASV
jgi:hypothetical protein